MGGITGVKLVSLVSIIIYQVHDREKLIEMILRGLSLAPGLCEGVGQLLFEWCRGVPQQFHSCCEAVFSLLLGKLGDPGLPGDLVFQALCKMVELMAAHTRREFSQPVWGPLLVRDGLGLVVRD